MGADRHRMDVLLIDSLPLSAIRESECIGTDREGHN